MKLTDKVHRINPFRSKLTFEAGFFIIHTSKIALKFITDLIVIFTESKTIFSCFETIVLACFGLWFPEVHAIIVSDKFWTESQIDIGSTWTAFQTVDTAWAVIFATFFLSFTIGQAISITSTSKIAVVFVVCAVSKTFLDLFIPKNFTVA